jgi:hypothetical protein
MKKATVIEYIGPYGVGKTTWCTRKTFMKCEAGAVCLLDDFYAFVSASSIGLRLMWILRNMWSYIVVGICLSYCVRKGSLPERFSRARMTARKMVYIREFVRGREGWFVNDEGILHSVCQAITGVSGGLNRRMIALLYRDLQVRFVYLVDDEESCVERVLRRNTNDEASVSYPKGSFLDLINSSDENEVRILVRHSTQFYDSVEKILIKRWHLDKIDLAEQGPRHTMRGTLLNASRR